MSTTTKTIHFTMRMPPELKELLVMAAEKEGRTPTNLALFAIKQYLNQHHKNLESVDKNINISDN